jgi:ubiquinone/menaquinone biosynthesis C-methylase UbiE
MTANHPHPLWKRLEKALETHTLEQIDSFHVGGKYASKALLSTVTLPPNAHVLDIGCGIGGTSRLIHLSGMTVVGIDLNPHFCQIARTYTPSSPPFFITGDATQLPFVSGCFDVVLSEHVQMAIQNKERWLHDTYRVLKIGGYCLLHEVFLTNHSTTQNLTYPLPWTSQKSHNHVVTEKLFLELAQSVGFKLLKSTSFTQQGIDLFKKKFKDKQTTAADILIDENAKNAQQNVLSALENNELSITQIYLQK